MSTGWGRTSAYWQERDPKYFTHKIDPGDGFMRELRARLHDTPLKAHPGNHLK